MDNNFKEVRFDKYCKKCKHHDVKEYEDPCNECLESGMNEGSEKPVKFVEGAKVKEGDHEKKE